MIGTIINKIKFLTVRRLAPALIKGYYFFKRNSGKSVLVIKNDGIGDYILFRNYLRFIKESKKYKDHKLYLLGSVACKDLALHLEKDVVDGFFWYADSYFMKWDVLRLLVGLQKLRLGTVIYPNYSRKTTVDWLVKNINAANKIGVDGDHTNQPVSLKQRGNSSYTRLISLPAEPMHEFERNKQFFEAVTGEKCSYERPGINRRDISIVSSGNIVVFIGASDKKRRWANQNFAELSKMLALSAGINVIIAGGRDEMPDAGEIMHSLNDLPVSNQAGLLTLVQLCGLIGGCRLVICCDTVAVHIAVSLAVPVVCISKGDLYGRFIPYPATIPNKVVTVLPDNLQGYVPGYSAWSEININAVTVNAVFNAAETALKKHHFVTS